MTIVAVDTSDHHHLQLDSIPVIDLSLLSQSELTSLSLCSDNAFDLHRCDDVVIPKIDRTVFNESAGSRKQTYSRLRLAPRKPEISAVGRGRYNPVAKPHSNPVDDPERKENKQIVSLLRELFGKDSSIQFKDPPLDNLDYEILPEESTPIPMMLEAAPAAPATPSALAASQVLTTGVGVGSSGVVKRKRGRPRKEALNVEPTPPKPKIRKLESDDFYESVPIEENVVMEIVNRNGVVVDLAALACSEDPFGPELRRRSAGLVSEEELLAFLRDLNGQWGSRRKKRKVVDASDFGDALPVGWKLLLSLKRKEGNLSLYCRRYISPTGQQFVSCKDVSSYLLPFFGFEGEAHPNLFQSDESDYEAGKVSSGSSAGLAHNAGSTLDELNYYEASPISSFSPENEKQLASLGTENLADVEIKDLLECHICKTNFHEKDAYLQHLLSSHQRNGKKPRHSNSSVCDGVIIKDGKFECQFCHKIFAERHRYNGHVGVHVRNYVRSQELPPGGTAMQIDAKPVSVSGVLPGFSEVDASAETKEVSVPLASVPNNETTMSGFSRVEASGDMMEKSSVASIPVHIDEKSMGSETKIPVSTLPGFCARDGSDASISEHNDERSLENITKPSTSMLPSFSATDGSDASISAHNDQNSLENITEPSASMLPGFSATDGSDASISAHNDQNSLENITEPSASMLPGFSTRDGSDASIFSHNDESSLENITKPSVGAGMLPGFSATDGSAASISAHNDESSLENITKPSAGMLPGFSATDGSDASISAHNDESSLENIAKPSAAILPGFSAMDGLDASISAHNDERNLENITKPSTSMLPGFSATDGSDASVSAQNDQNSLENITEPSASMLPGFSAIEGLDDIEKGSLPPVSTSNDERSTENNIKESPVAGVIPGLLGMESNATEKGHDVPVSIPNNGAILQDDLKPSSVSGVLAETEIDSPCGELDSVSNSDDSSAKPNSDLNSPCGEPDGGSCSSQQSPVNSNIEKVGSPPDNQGLESRSGNSASTSKFELNADPPCCKDDSRTNRVTGTLGAEAGDRPYSGVEMTDDKQCDVDKVKNTLNGALESCFGSGAVISKNFKDGISEAFKEKDFFASSTGGRLDQSRNDLNGGFRSCLGSATTLGNNTERGSFERFEGKDFFNSTTDGKFGKVEQTNNDVDGDFRSFLGSAASLRSDMDRSTNISYEGNNIFSSTAPGINMSGFKHGESSFSFSFAPSGTSLCDNVEDGAAESFTGKDGFRSTADGKSGKFDKPNSDIDGDFRSCLGSATALLNDVQNGTNVGYEGSNLFTSTATTIGMSGFKQGDGSFNFSFAPSVSEKANGFDICKDDVFSMSLKEPELVKGSQYGFTEPERCFRSNTRQSNEYSLLDSIGTADRETILQRLVADTSSPLPQSSGCFRTLDLMPHKGQESENYPLQKFDNMSSFEELGLDDLEPKFSFVTGKQSSALTQEPMDLGYDSVMEEALNTTVQFEWDPVLPKMDSNQQQSAMCVWCRLPFIHDAINHEMQSDSVGFMCPTCKANISGQLNVLDNDGLSLSFDHL